jgi:hypothetical protein
MKMKAIVYTKYGSLDVLQLKEVEKPTHKDNEVLIKVYATAVTKYDCWMRSSIAPPGFGLLMRMRTRFGLNFNPTNPKRLIFFLLEIFFKYFFLPKLIFLCFFLWTWYFHENARAD